MRCFVLAAALLIAAPALAGDSEVLYDKYGKPVDVEWLDSDLDARLKYGAYIHEFAGQWYPEHHDWSLTYTYNWTLSSRFRLQASYLQVQERGYSASVDAFERVPRDGYFKYRPATFEASGRTEKEEVWGVGAVIRFGKRCSTRCGL